MRRKLRNLKNKGGASQNGAPQQMLDEAVYREHFNRIAGGGAYDSEYSGWSHASRPRDQAISLRRTRLGTGTTGMTSPPQPPP